MKTYIHIYISSLPHIHKYSVLETPEKSYFSFFDDIFNFNVIEIQGRLKISHLFPELLQYKKISWNNYLKKYYFEGNWFLRNHVIVFSKIF